MTEKNKKENIFEELSRADEAMIKEGIFKPGFSHIFSKLMKCREEADYNPFYILNREDFGGLRKEVEDVSEKTKAYLKSKGYLSS